MSCARSTTSDATSPATRAQKAEVIPLVAARKALTRLENVETHRESYSFILEIVVVWTPHIVQGIAVEDLRMKRWYRIP